MAALISTQDIVSHLRSEISGVEIFDEWPSDPKKTRTGIYVDEPLVSEQVTNTLGLTEGGSIYDVTDKFSVLYVTFQGDNRASDVEEAILSLQGNIDLSDGYKEFNFKLTSDYQNRAEYRLYDFTWKRIEVS